MSILVWLSFLAGVFLLFLQRGRMSPRPFLPGAERLLKFGRVYDRPAFNFTWSDGDGGGGRLKRVSL